MKRNIIKSVCLSVVLMTLISLPMAGLSESVIVDTAKKYTGEPQVAAMNFVKDNNPQFLTSNLKALNSIKRENFSSTILYEEVGGIPVIDSEIVVNINNDGNKVFQNRELTFAKANKGEGWTLSEDKALEFAVAYLAENKNKDIALNEELLIFSLEPKKVYVKSGDTYVPAYLMVIPTVNPTAVWEVVVNAGDGAVIKSKDIMIKTTSGKGSVIEKTSDFVNNQSPLGLKQKSLPDMYTLKEKYSYDKDFYTYYRTAGKYFDVRSTVSANESESFINLAYRARSADKKFNYTTWASAPWACANTEDRDKFDEVNAYYHLNAGRNYFKKNFKFNLLDYTMPVIANAKSFWGNAAYIPSDDFFSPMVDGFVFGNQITQNGDVCVSAPADAPHFNDAAEDPQVILHELAHAAFQKMNPVAASLYYGEIGGLNEGNSDLWSIVASSRKKTDPAVMGAIIAQYYPGYQRYLDYYIHYPEIYENPDNLSDSAWITDNVTATSFSLKPAVLDLEVHIAGTLWGPLLYEIGNNLGSKGLKLIFDSVYFIDANTNGTAGYATGMKAFLNVCEFTKNTSYFNKSLGFFTSRGVACYRPVRFSGSYQRNYLIDSQGNISPANPATSGEYKIIKGIRKTYVYRDGFQDLRYETNGPVLAYAGYTIKQENNGIPEGGETVGINVTIANSGDEAASNVVATLSLISDDSKYITFSDASAAYGSIGIGSSKASNENFVINISEDIPDQRIVYFQLAIQSDEGVWTSVFPMQITNKDSDLVIAGIEIIDTNTGSTVGNGNGYAEAGETIGLKIKIKNQGKKNALNVVGNLSSANTNLLVTRDQVNYGEIPFGQTIIPDAYFIVDLKTTFPNAQNSVSFTLGLTSTRGNWNHIINTTVYNKQAKVEYVEGSMRIEEIAGSFDGVVTNGDSIGVFIKVKNSGQESAKNVQAKLVKLDTNPNSTTKDYYSIIQNTEIVGFPNVIMPDETKESLQQFQISIVKKIDQDFYMSLGLLIKHDDKSFDDATTIPLKILVKLSNWDPDIKIKAISYYDGAAAFPECPPYCWFNPGVSGNSNFKVEPDEYVGVYITLQNQSSINGSETARNVTATLDVDVDDVNARKYVTVLQYDNLPSPTDLSRHTREYGDIEPGSVGAPININPVYTSYSDVLYLIHIDPKAPNIRYKLKLTVKYWHYDQEINDIQTVTIKTIDDLNGAVQRQSVIALSPPVIDDSVSINPANNDNMICEPGEYIDLNFKLKNNAPSIDYNAVGTVEIFDADRDYVIFRNAKGEPDPSIKSLPIKFGNLIFNKEKENLGGAIPIYIDPNTPSGAYVRFVINVNTQTVPFDTTSNLSYTVTSSLNITKPSLVLVPPVDIDDDTLGQSSGDNDQLAEAGEVIEYRPKVKNQFIYCPDDAPEECDLHNVYATISTDNDYVKIIDNKIFYGDIKKNEIVAPPLNLDTFVVKYDSSLPYNSKIVFTVKIFSDEEPSGWSNSFKQIVYSTAQHLDDIYDLSPNNNDTAELAAEVGAGIIQNLICADDDFYKIQVPPNYTLKCRIDFRWIDGDLDLNLYDQYRLDQDPLTRSRQPKTDFEEVEFANTGAGIHYFYLQVYQREDINVATEYTMTLTLTNNTMAPVGLPDADEDKFVIDDDNIGGSFGNSNGIPEVGETIQLRPVILNRTVNDAYNVVVSIGYYSAASGESLDNFVTHDAFPVQINYKNIESQTYKMTDDSVKLTIKPNFPVHDSSYSNIRFFISIEYTMLGQQRAWIEDFNLNVQYPKIKLTNPIEVIDTITDRTWGNGDGVVDAGETVGIPPEASGGYRLLYDLEATILNFNMERYIVGPVWKRLFRSKVNIAGMWGYETGNTEQMYACGYHYNFSSYPSGVLYKASGGTWVPEVIFGANGVEMPGIRLHSIAGAKATSPSPEMLAVGDNGIVLHYDSANKWQIEPTGVSYHLYSVWTDDKMTSAVAVGESGAILERHIINGSPQWIDRTGEKYAIIDPTTGIDYSWTKGQTLYSVSGTTSASNQHIVAVGANGVIYKYKNGVWRFYWEDLNIVNPIYAAPTKTLRGIDFATSNKAYIVGASGLIYRLVLGGDGNDPGANSIEKLTVVNSPATPRDLVGVWAMDNGGYAYAVGDNGTIIEIKQFAGATSAGTYKPCIDNINIMSVFGFDDFNYYVGGGLPNINFTSTTPNPYISFRGNYVTYTVDPSTSIYGQVALTDPFSDPGLPPYSSNMFLFFAEPSINDMTMFRLNMNDANRKLSGDVLINVHNPLSMISADEAEPNDTFAEADAVFSDAAKKLTTGYHTFSVYKPALYTPDEDYFKFEVPAYSEFIVSLNIEPFYGNLELRLYDQDKNLLDENIVRDNVQVQCFTVNNTAAAKYYYIHVKGRIFESWEKYLSPTMTERNTYILFVGTVPNQKKDASVAQDYFEKNIQVANQALDDSTSPYLPTSLTMPPPAIVEKSETSADKAVKGPVPAPTPKPTQSVITTYGYPRSTTMPDIYFIKVGSSEQLEVKIEAQNGAVISSVALFDPYDLRRFEEIPWGDMTIYQFGTISGKKATLQFNAKTYLGYDTPTDNQYGILVMCSQGGKYKIEMKVKPAN